MSRRWNKAKTCAAQRVMPCRLPRDIASFRCGDCGTYAYALHLATGWPFYAVQETLVEPHSDGTPDTALLHAFVSPDAGQHLVDVCGVHTVREVLRYWNRYKQDDVAKIEVIRLGPNDLDGNIFPLSWLGDTVVWSADPFDMQRAEAHIVARKDL